MEFRNFVRSGIVLTETHAAETLQDGQRYHQADVSFALHAEHEDHEYEHQSSLSAHDDELRDDVREQYLQRSDACEGEKIR